MKNVFLTLIAFFLLTVSVTAKETEPIKAISVLRTEIIDLIGANCPYDYDKNECTAQVLFTVNLDGEIIIISIDSPNKLAESYLKRKLNYQKVNFRPTKEGTIYLLPLRMVKDN